MKLNPKKHPILPLLVIGASIPLLTHGQEATADSDQIFDLGTFEVTSGFAASQAAAIETKRLQPVIVEAVVAEDIGKLPDTSIAETLSRLPGITSHRVNGRSQELVIRGFSGDFTTTLLNGREQVSAGSSRAVEFDQYPAELLSGAIVYKTGDASLTAQGIAGTVDLRTVRPLKQGKRMMAFNAFYEWLEMDELNAGSKSDGYRLSGSYIDQFADNTIGLALGVSLTSKPGQGEQWNAWGYPTTGEGNFVLGGAKPFVRSSELDRDGYMAVLQYRPSETFNLTFDAYYSDFAETQTLRGIELPLFWSSAMLQPGATVEDGVIMQGTFSNVHGVIRNDVAVKDAKIYAAGLNFEFGDGNGWDTQLDLSYSFVDREETVLESYSGTGSNQSGPPDTVTYSLESGTGAVFTPTLDYTDTSLLVLTSPQGWGGDVVPGGQLGYLKEPLSEDELVQAKVVTGRYLEGGPLRRVFSHFETGLNVTRRTKFEYEAGKFIAGANGATELPFPNSIGVTDLSFIGIPGMASYDPLAVLNSDAYELIVNPNADVQTADWNVEETITTYYAQLDIEADAGRFPVTGNIGFQVVHADQQTEGVAAQGTGASVVAVDVSGGTDYVDFVPSLNLNVQLTENDFLRLSAARQLARQPMSDMRAGNQFGVNPAEEIQITSSGGNPELEPWRANAFDVSLEHYFPEDRGYFSITGFYKDLVSYTYDETEPFDFSGYPVPPEIDPQGTITIPQNGSGGFMKGIELTASLSGQILSEALEGFGLIASISFVDSSISPDLNNPSVPLPGLSDTVSSVTLYYEKAGFSARVSNRYRSEYRGDIVTFGPRSEDFRTISAETVWDAQMSYAFQEGSMKGFSIILQAYNLTDEPLSAFNAEDQRLVRDYQRYGASYAIGMSYKY
ncbi:MAG: TonB-dependent receptor [Opitutales bacterium]